MILRCCTVVFLATLWVVAGSLPARADPAGPTDYLTEVVEIDPPLAGVGVEVVGGDAFIRLEVAESHEVQVVGYRGEPYLWFHPDGSVEENELSPSTYLNQDRYAIAEIPDAASASADPRWREVATEGSYSWHDHRAHWMNEQPPPGAEPGDQILEGVIPIVVDGYEVDITVISVWQESPQPWPQVAGLVVGVFLGWIVLRGRDHRLTCLVVLALAAAATAVGLVAYLSVPAETGPPVFLWLVPLTSVALATLALRPSLGGRWASRVGDVSSSLVLIASVELTVWGVVRRDWLLAAILPTSLSYGVDRFVTAMVLVGGALATWHLFRARLTTRPASAH